jgi:ATP diphosphatase
MDGVSANLPALTWATKVGKRAARVGFDWPGTDGVLEKIREELRELETARTNGDSAAVEEEFGDLLLAMTSLARHLDMDPETALRQANRKFLGRFAALEESLAGDQVEWSALTPEQLEQRWQAVK